MRLLLTADTVGGVWTFACELASELLRRGNDVLLVSFGRVPSASQRDDAASLAGHGRFRYLPTEMPLEWMPDNRSAYTAPAPLLLQLCEQFRPDALLLSQFCFGALPVSVPKLVIAHSDVLSWADAVGKAPLAADEWLQTYCRLVQAGLSAADGVVAPSAAMLADLKRHFQVPRVSGVVANGRTLRQGPDVKTKHLRAITAGRLWDPAKNLEMLQTAELPMPVLVAGDAAGATCTNNQVTLLGSVASGDLLRLFRESAVYLCCSQYEPFGLAPLEAALCGCAVVANDIPSLREVWGDGALYFSGGASLSALLHLLATEPLLLAAAQARSVGRARGYSAATMADGYLHALAAVTASSEAVYAA